MKTNSHPEAARRSASCPVADNWNAADHFNPDEWSFSFQEDWEKFKQRRQKPSKVLTRKLAEQLQDLKIH